MSRYLLSLAMFSGLFFSSNVKSAAEYNCSNSDGSIKYAGGQGGDIVTWTEPQIDDKGRTSYVPIRQRVPSGSSSRPYSFDPLYVDVEVTFEVAMELEDGYKENKSGCQEGVKESWVSVRRDFLGKVTIVKKGGLSFPEGTRNLLQDGKTISAHLMCSGGYYLGSVSCP